MSAQHTPGPWFVENDRIMAPESITYIADLRYPCDESAVEKLRYEADGWLIAAAPDMLAALEALIESSDYADFYLTGLDEAKEAVAKAKGIA